MTLLTTKFFACEKISGNEKVELGGGGCDELGHRLLRWRLLGSLDEFLDKTLGFQPVHGRESIKGHVDISGVLRFQPQTLSNQNIPYSRESNKKVSDRGVATNIFDRYP